jgi:hypothetical protein
MRRDVYNFSHHKYRSGLSIQFSKFLYISELVTVSDSDASEVCPVDAMAAPLRRVSDCHQTRGRMRVTSGVPGNAVVPLRVPDVPSDGSTPSPHATPSNVSFFSPSQSATYYPTVCH